MCLRIGFLLLLNLLLVVSAQSSPAQRQFADWQVTCSNRHVCQARNNINHQGLVMILRSSAGKKDKVSLRIQHEHQQYPSGLAQQLLLDNTSLQLPAGHWHNLPDRVISNDRTWVNAFLQQLKQHHTITLSHGNGMISLHGLPRVLLFMRQWLAQKPQVSAVNTPPAVDIQPAGSNPTNSVALTTGRATPVTPLTPQERNELIRYAYWRIQHLNCSISPARRVVQTGALTDDKALILVSCEEGAYNVVDLAWIVQRDQPLNFQWLKLRLPFMLRNSNTNQLELINARFDEHSGLLTTLAKGRAAGDCGVATRWRFDGENFQLIRYARQPICDGWYNSSEQWPILWTTE